MQIHGFHLPHNLSLILWLGAAPQAWSLATLRSSVVFYCMLIWNSDLMGVLHFYLLNTVTRLLWELGGASCSASLCSGLWG